MAGGFWDTEVVLKDVQKPGTKSTFYRFKDVTKGNKRYIDMREHYTKADGTEQFTSKGTSIPIEAVADVMNVFRDLMEYLETGDMMKWEE